jgi:site-specific recombinase XerD
MLPQRVPQPAPLDLAIAAWLDASEARSQSQRTRQTYAAILATFRVCLGRMHLDLDAPPRLVALVAQQYANRGRPAAATHNARLSALSSFYAYAMRMELLEHNPIARVQRRRVEPYAGSRALNADVLRAQLAQIDRSTVAGARDVALLAVALTTGRRVSELAGLRRRDVHVAGQVVTLHWRRLKGGKQAADTLDEAVGLALLAYLHRLHSKAWRTLPPDAAVWRASHQRQQQPLSTRAIARICLRRLGTESVHRLRHTFAHELEAAGAPASAIQRRLAHSSLATTGRYLSALSSAASPFAARLARRFGLVAGEA